MTWFAWLLIVHFVTNALAHVALIGRPRKPITHTDAVVNVLWGAFYLWAVLALAGVA